MEHNGELCIFCLLLSILIFWLLFRDSTVQDNKESDKSKG